jgi:hypothetical protein
MKNRRFPRVAATALGALVAAGAAPPASAGSLEVKAFAVDNFTTGQCGGGDRTWSEMIGNWYYQMAFFGHTLSGFKIDGDMNRGRFCDPDTGLSGCEDYNYVDSADVVMIGFHGGDTGKHWQGLMRKNGGSSVNDCYIDAPDAPGNGELFLGDMDAEFFHMSSCNSMDDNNMPNVWRMFEDPVDSPVNGRRLHQATGFHGMMGIGSSYDIDYFLFGFAAQYASIKDAWMDTMYHPEMENVKCPVAYAVGTNKNNCFTRIDNETYKNVYSDPSSLGYYCYYYYDKCDPAAEFPFTPPE